MAATHAPARRPEWSWAGEGDERGAGGEGSGTARGQHRQRWDATAATSGCPRQGRGRSGAWSAAKQRAGAAAGEPGGAVAWSMRRTRPPRAAVRATVRAHERAGFGACRRGQEHGGSARATRGSSSSGSVVAATGVHGTHTCGGHSDEGGVRDRARAVRAGGKPQLQRKGSYGG
nr:spidroin-1-like [Aegilops tauschii subsp. strangulata]